MSTNLHLQPHHIQIHLICASPNTYPPNQQYLTILSPQTFQLLKIISCIRCSDSLDTHQRLHSLDYESWDITLRHVCTRLARINDGKRSCTVQRIQGNTFSVNIPTSRTRSNIVVKPTNTKDTTQEYGVCSDLSFGDVSFLTINSARTKL